MESSPATTVLNAVSGAIQLEMSDARADADILLKFAFCKMCQGCWNTLWGEERGLRALKHDS